MRAGVAVRGGQRRPGEAMAGRNWSTEQGQEPMSSIAKKKPSTATQ